VLNVELKQRTGAQTSLKTYCASKGSYVVLFIQQLMH